MNPKWQRYKFISALNDSTGLLKLDFNHPTIQMLACDRLEIYVVNINVKSGGKQTRIHIWLLFLCVTHMYNMSSELLSMKLMRLAVPKTERKIWIYLQPRKLKILTYALNRWTLCIFIAHPWQAVRSLAMLRALLVSMHFLSLTAPILPGHLHAWWRYM